LQRIMTSTSNLPQWTAPNDDGTYNFTSWFLGAPGAWTEGRFGKDTGRNALMLIPAVYGYWYNRNATAENWITKWKLAEPSLNLVGTAYLLSRPEADRQAWLNEQFARGVKPLRGRSRDVSNLLAFAGHVPENSQKALADYVGKQIARDRLMNQYTLNPDPWSALMDSDLLWLHYEGTKDTKVLADACRQAAIFVHSFEWLHTIGCTNGDRIPLPRSPIVRARMGALPAHRAGNGSWWPMHGISYERGAREIASLVGANTNARLSLRLYAFTTEPHNVVARLWRLDPGTYTMTLAEDANDDGAPDKTLAQQEVAISRGGRVEVTLPPKKSLVLSFEAVKTEPIRYKLPDPAVSRLGGLLDYGEHLQVKVFNLGPVPAENVLVRISDPSTGNVLDETRIDRIPPFKGGFKLPWKIVQFQNVNCVTRGGVAVEADPKGEIEDFNRHNNRAVFRY